MVNSIQDIPVLIVGAGPTGLNLALRLARHGVRFRLIDQHSGPAQESRALAVHARTLEFYQQMKFADAIVERGTRIKGVRLHEDGRERAHIDLGDVGEGLSPFPFILDFPQDEHERFLVNELRNMGIEVERSTSLETFEQDDSGVVATIRLQDGRRASVRCAYLCGCDGARSVVRDRLAVEFPGGTYQHLYFVADVELRERDARHDLHLALGADSFALRLPARQGENERLIGLVPDGVGQPTFEDVRRDAERLLGVKVAALNWFSTYRVHHRVTDHFRSGRAFLLGDAGHLHSPVGGQGMNTGIGDAVNLSWKLAWVLGQNAAASLLDTYEEERIAFARTLVATTDRVFKLIVSRGLGGRLFRSFVAPEVFPNVVRFAAARRAIFRRTSQIAIRYPESSLSQGCAGSVAGGDRLPWVPAVDNFASLQRLAFQVHVYGDVSSVFQSALERGGMPLEVFGWCEAMSDAGLMRDAAYLIRPDGYVALAMPQPDAALLASFLIRLGLAPEHMG